MKLASLLILLTSLSIAGSWPGSVHADEAVLPPGDTAPVLRLETGGPRSYVSGLAFSPDGRQLYATGWDKAVQVWNRNAAGLLEYSAGATLRVPTGAGLYGGLNALALSPDGKWLATAGQGHTRDMSGERSVGWVLPAGTLSSAAQVDEGLIYVFNTATRQTTLLRGHRGPVQSLAFVRGSTSNPPELVSIAEERSDEATGVRPQLRFWNVGAGQQLAQLDRVPDASGKEWLPLPDLLGFRPGLTAWSSGADPRQARVALAWGDDQFRVWDVQTGQVAGVRTNPNTLTVLPLSTDGDRLLTGAHAEVGVWSLRAAADGRLAGITRQQFQPSQIDSIQGKIQNLPGAVALIPAGEGRPAHVAFIVTRYLPDGRGEYRLTLATAAAPVRTVREVRLPWQAELRQPSLAVSSDGRQLAIAGNERNEIEVFPVDELLAGGNPRPQVLGSVGIAFRDAAFVQTEDKRWGLLLSETRRDEAGKFPAGAVVLSIRDRQIARRTDDWRPANAEATGWSADGSRAGVLVVRRPDRPELELKLDANHVVTAWAFCPPSAQCPAALIAVATHLRGQPLLQWYRGDTGEPVRWCVGHTERIRSLSFSADGRMLLSVGDDRTVSLWTATDLATRTLGKHGRVPGLVVQTHDQRNIVTAAPDDRLIQIGDEIVAIVRGGEAVALRSAREFYQFILGQRPGDTVSLSIRRNGNVQTVKVPVGQAIDEVKPLCSLFVTPAAKPDDWEWIGWHPLGNFDARGDNVDRWLGWHFNTGEPAQPARFAPVGEYRDGFYRRDLLQSLFDSQQLVVTSAEEAPQLTTWLRHRDGTPVRSDYEDRPQFGSREIELVAEVKGVAERRLLGVTVAVDDADPIPLQSGASHEWTADLSRIAWQRGTHRLTVRLRTPDRQISRIDHVLYRPAGPVIDWEPPWKDELKSGDVTVEATVTPGSEPVEVQLLLQKPGQDEQTVIRTWQTRELLKISEKLQIEPGENRLELVAWNATVSAEDRYLETARLASFARRAAPPMAPRVDVTEIAALPDNGEPIPLELTEARYRTAWPRIRVKGRITAQADIGQAQLMTAEGTRDLTGFAPANFREFPFVETLTLRPGQQMLVVQSAVETASAEKRLFVSFEPPLPMIAALNATAAPLQDLPEGTPAAPLIFIAGYHEPTATVSAVLQGRLEIPYRAVFRVNDTVVAGEAVQVDRSRPDEHHLTARVPLTGGRNAVTLRLENDGGLPPMSQSVDLEFRRPPEVVQVLAETRLVDKPLDLTCRIRSALPVGSARLLIDEAGELTEFRLAPSPDAPGEWLLHAPQIGLSEGEHVIRITATNDEGVSLVPGIHKVRVERPAEKPPVLTLISPVPSASALTVNSSRLEIRYAVKSAVPATVQLQVRSSGGKSEPRTIAAAGVSIDGSVAVERIDLDEGVNTIELSAHNAGGFSEKQFFNVAYVPETISVEIVSVGDLQPQRRNDGSGRFDQAAPHSRMRLRGRVFARGKDHLEGDLAARIWVNSFKLPTVRIVQDIKQPNVGLFEADVVFNLPRNNRISVEVFRSEGRIAAELGCTNTLEIDCAEPEREQELYVLLLGVGDADQMRARARSALLEGALRAQPLSHQQTSQEVWKSDGFTRIHVHDGLNATPAAVQNRLRELVGTMLSNLSRGIKSGPQSIVMVYYQGQITLTDDNFAFGTSDRAITGRILEENLSRSYGSHLIFLDLQQKTESLEARDVWPRAPHLGIAVSNWRGQGAPPRNSLLISVLEQALPQTRVVRELALKIDQQYAANRQQFPDQFETVNLLKDVYDLRIGAVE